MTKNSDIEKSFDTLMKKIEKENKKRVTTDRQILSDIDALRCEENKGLIGYNKELECKETKNNDNIISPNHYASDKGFEVFDVQEAFIHELKGMAASYWCNIVKYILRFQRKNGVEDLKKAKYYLEKLIEEEAEE